MQTINARTYLLGAAGGLVAALLFSALVSAHCGRGECANVKVAEVRR